MLQNTKGAIKNGQSKETCNARRKKKKKKDTTQYVSDTAMWKQTQRM